MSVSSDSEDSADTFWPGYVDAISNLAINLLFVIAVMAIVVIGATLQLSDMTKRKDTATDDGVAVSAVKVEDNKAGPGMAIEKKSVSTNQAASADQQRLMEQEKTIKQQSDRIQQLQIQLQTAKATAAKLTNQTSEINLPPTDKVEELTAKKEVQASDGKNTFTSVAGGVIVYFNKDVIELTKEEMISLTDKIKTFGPLNASSKWHINVVVPKGFSEATRLGFYRANVVRNLLLQNGVKGENIDLKVLESERRDADSARVVVRPS